MKDNSSSPNGAHFPRDALSHVGEASIGPLLSTTNPKTGPEEAGSVNAHFIKMNGI